MSRVIVASGSQIAVDAGAAIADRGGNAVDAALATALVSMCTEPGVIAPGASGFITIWAPEDHPIVIDAYAEMPGRGLEPEKSGRGIREVFFDYGGGMRTLIGYGSIATPGILAGLGMAAEEYGNLPWAEIVEPARQWAERGFALPKISAEYLAYAHEAIFGWNADSYKTLHHADGSCLREGEIVHIPGLADSLQLIGDRGAEVFYQGELAQRIAAEIQAGEGLLSAADLAEYRAIKRSPICINFDDWEVITNPPPAIGGACLAAMLLLLDNNFNSFTQWNSAAVKKMVAIQQAVLDYRNRHFDTVNSSSVVEAVSRLLDLAGLGNPQALLKSPSTIHVSAVDDNGLACSVSASAGYGSGVMIANTGLWLNNSLGEVELHPSGLEGIAPGTRLTSNMAPTIARYKDGTVLAIGSPGASRITTAIAQVLVNYIHLGMSLSEAIAHPRLHVEVFEGASTVALEPGLKADSIEGFVTRQFPQPSMYFGGVQAALWSPQNGLTAAADPRRNGGIACGGTD